MYAGRPVIDKTGLTGFYDFEMEWMLDGPPNAEPSDPAGSSVFTVLQRLGLKLEGGKAPYDTVVIDHVVTNLG